MSPRNDICIALLCLLNYVSYVKTLSPPEINPQETFSVQGNESHK